MTSGGGYDNPTALGSGMKFDGAAVGSIVLNNIAFEKWSGVGLEIGSAAALILNGGYFLDGFSDSLQTAIRYTGTNNTHPTIINGTKFFSSGWKSGAEIHVSGSNPTVLMFGKSDGSQLNVYDETFLTTAKLKTITGSASTTGLSPRFSAARIDRLNVLCLQDYSAFQNIGTTGTDCKRIFISDDGSSIDPTTADGATPGRGDLSLNDWFRMTTANGAMGCVMVYNGSSVVTLKWGPIENCEFDLRNKNSTVATLPTAGSKGRMRFVTDGRKDGEGSGAGTGTMAYDDGTAWRRVSDDSTVVA
jgi:hypothetical protein